MRQRQEVQKSKEFQAAHGLSVVGTAINVGHGRLFHFIGCFSKNSQIKSFAEMFFVDFPMKLTGGCFPGQVSSVILAFPPTASFEESTEARSSCKANNPRQIASLAASFHPRGAVGMGRFKVEIDDYGDFAASTGIREEFQ